MNRWLSAAVLVLSTPVLGQVRYQPAGAIRFAADCDVLACASPNQVCVETTGTPGQGILYLCNSSTALFSPNWRNNGSALFGGLSPVDPQPVFFGAGSGSTTGRIASLTLRDTNPAHSFGELAFQNDTGVDIWHIIQDPDFIDTEDLRIRRKGQEVLRFDPLSATGSDVLATYKGTRWRYDRSGPSPVEFRDTSFALPSGLWRFVFSGDNFLVNRNTAVAGDFSTNFDLIKGEPSGKVTIGQGDLQANANMVVKGPSPWVDVRAFAAKCDNSTNDTTAIQNAINFAFSTGGSVNAGIVHFPSGICMATQIEWKRHIILEGEGAPPVGNTRGTTLQQIAGTNLDFIITDTTLLPGQFFHGAAIRNMSIVGNAGDTTGNGIKFNSITGEQTKLERIKVQAFPQNCIYLAQGSVPFYGEQLNLNTCGDAGIRLEAGSAPTTAFLIDISGDDNLNALVYAKTGGGTGVVTTLLINGLKSEKINAGRNNNSIVIDTYNGSPVTVMNARLSNTSAEQANAVVQIVGAVCRLSWIGLAKEPDVTSIVDDAINTRTFTDPVGFIGNSNFNIAATSLLLGAASSALDVSLARGAANRLDLGTGDSLNIVSGNVTINGDDKAIHFVNDQGTALAGSNVVLSAGWGTGNSVSTVSGRNSAMKFTANSGTTPGANPTITVTFPSAFTGAPACTLYHGTSDTAVLDTYVTTTTTLTITFNGTPTASVAHDYQVVCIGT